MPTKAVLLCGGLATRMLPVTKTIPKEMLPIVNRPAIDYCIEDLRANGIKDVLIILGRGKECLENYFDRNVELEHRLLSHNKNQELADITKQFQDMNISFIRQVDARGTGYATRLAKNFVGKDNFILMYPDDITMGFSLSEQLLAVHQTTGGSVIPLKRIDIKDCSKYGMVGIKQSKTAFPLISTFVEKPEEKDSPSNICYTGSGLFTSEIFEHLNNCPFHENGEQYLTDAFAGLIDNESLFGFELRGTRLDVGTPLGLVTSNVLAALYNPDLHDDLVTFLKSLHLK